MCCHQAPNPAASEFIPKGAPRMANMAQSAVQAFPSPLFAHPGLGSSTAAALAPGVGFFEMYKLRNYPALLVSLTLCLVALAHALVLL